MVKCTSKPFGFRLRTRKSGEGLHVKGVEEDSQVYANGMRTGMVITHVNGELASMELLREAEVPVILKLRSS